MENEMHNFTNLSIYLIWIIPIFSMIVLIGFFYRMKKGFGPFNFKVLVIIIVATFTSLLALNDANSLNAALGILGAIVGYVFGFTSEKSQKDSSANVDSSTLGDNNKIAGRDINEFIKKIESDLTEIKNARFASSEKPNESDYLIHHFFERNNYQEKFEEIITAHEKEDWKFKFMTSDFQGTDGIFLIFEKPKEKQHQKVNYLHGKNFRSGYQ